ncbi:MAG: hypothetical protein IJZ95_07265 [Oscillospiraceae bacterium]|nr:hypothetical protein [Oscillospiraceae bacterium]
MRKTILFLLCVAVCGSLMGCSVSDVPPSNSESDLDYIYTTKRTTATTTTQKSIPQVKDGVDLDDVEKLVKEAIRKGEMKSQYRTAYYKVTNEIDDFLNDVTSGFAVEYDVNYLLEKYKEACDAGFDFLDSCIGVDAMYSLFKTGGLDREEKDLLRTCLTIFNKSKAAIEDSYDDMVELITPIIDEPRKLTEDEINEIYDIYQVLIDKIDTADSIY